MAATVTVKAVTPRHLPGAKFVSALVTADGATATVSAAQLGLTRILGLFVQTVDDAVVTDNLQVSYDVADGVGNTATIAATTAADLYNIIAIGE